MGLGAIKFSIVVGLQLTCPTTFNNLKIIVMFPNEKIYYILKNVQPKNSVDLDFNVVEASSDFDGITNHYFDIEKKAVENYRKSFRCYNDNNSWSFVYNDEKDNEITYVFCSDRNVRDYIM